MNALNWDPSKSLYGPWQDAPETLRTSGNARQRRKAKRATGWRASVLCKRHGKRHDPEEYLGCATCIEEYIAEEKAADAEAAEYFAITEARDA